MKSVFNRYYKRYDAWYDRNKFAYLSELKAVEMALPKKGIGLEIGVGTGRFAAPLGIKFGVDPSSNMLRTAAQRGVNVRLGFGEHLPYKNEAFDYAAVIITICFVKDAPKVLKEIGRILKKKGKIIIGIIDKESFLGKFYRKKKGLFYKQASFFSAREISMLLKSAGFSRFIYYQSLFRLPQDIDSVERPKKGFGKGGFVVISGVRK